ncbi:hypothetical protein F4804DRAFT_140239 [Jackrogersella minutella]|nr:hypothetical protein F4804DRAFT_140239 [Jackrogersella minutella]
MATEVSNSTQPKSSSWISKPPRLRAACMECHAAKTRCSGEKSGCQRCLNSDLTCEYGMSMVGRGSKRRATNANQVNRSSSHRSPRRSPHAPESHPPSTIATQRSQLEQSNQIAPPLTRVTLGDPIIHPADNIFQSPHLLDEQLLDGFDFTFFHPLAGTTKSPALDDINGIGFDGFTAFSDPESTGSSSAPTVAGQLSSASPLQSSHPGDTPLSSTDHGSPVPMGHVIGLCKMVQLLETQIQSKTTAIDKIMRMNQTCITGVVKITEESDCMKCKSCPSLISTIMELIVTLYEAGLQAQDQNPQSYETVDDNCRMPHLTFGVFQLDPEEQAAMRKRIIGKEVKACIRIVQKLRPSLSASSQNPPLSVWYDDMESRMLRLVSSLE